MFVAPGCVDYPRDSSESPQRRLAEATHQNKQLREQIERLTAESTILKARLTELRQRESALSERLHKLAFLLEHQERQVKALRDAAADRDRYKTYAKNLQRRIDLLTKQIADLRALVSSLAGRHAVAKATPARPTPTTAPSPTGESKPTN